VRCSTVAGPAATAVDRATHRPIHTQDEGVDYATAEPLAWPPGADVDQVT
jgi:hypothetical protein